MSRLFPFTPALSNDSRLTYSHKTEIQRKKKGSELRASLSSHIMRSMKIDYLLENEEAQRCREFFDSITSDSIRVPDWTSPAKIASINGNTLSLENAEGLDFRVFSVFVIDSNGSEGKEYALNSYNTTSHSMVLSEAIIEDSDCLQVYPVRIFKLASLPSFPARGDNQFSFQISLEELTESFNSAIDWPDVEPLRTFRNHPVLRLFRKGTRENWESHISYEKKGFGTETVYQREDQAKRRISFSFYQATRAELYGLVQFFDNRRGKAGAFWISTDRCNYNLAEDVVAGSLSVIIKGEEYADLYATRKGYGNINLRCGFEDSFRKVESVEIENGNTKLTINEAIAELISASEGVVSSIILARFANDSLALSMGTDQHAKGNASCVEVFDEEDDTSDISRPVFLYEITGFYNGKMTSHGLPVTSNSETFERENINHGAITHRAQSISSSCSVTFYPREEHALHAFQKGYPVEPMSVTIYSADAVDPDTREIEYKGAVKKMSYGDKGAINLSLGSPSDSANSEIPSAFIEPRCSRQFLKTGCNLNPLDFQITGDVVTINERTITVNEAQSEAVSRGFGDWFLHGQIIIGNERRSIIEHYSSTIKVTSPFIEAKAGDSATLIAGCNRTQSHCKSRFDNFANYGGAPFVPPKNPALEAIRINSSAGQGGKK